MIFVDQLAKLMVTKTNNNLIMTNSGIAFGILPNLGFFLVIVALAALLTYFARVKYSAVDRMTMIGWGLLFGGSISNLVDRLRIGQVIDFLRLPLWPAFNLADCAIVFGVAVVIIRMSQLAKGE